MPSCSPRRVRAPAREVRAGHRRALHRRAARHLDADDVAQDVKVRLWRELPQGQVLLGAVPRRRPQGHRLDAPRPLRGKRPTHVPLPDGWDPGRPERRPRASSSTATRSRRCSTTLDEGRRRQVMELSLPRAARDRARSPSGLSVARLRRTLGCTTSDAAAVWEDSNVRRGGACCPAREGGDTAVPIARRWRRRQKRAVVRISGPHSDALHSRGRPERWRRLGRSG